MECRSRHVAIPLLLLLALATPTVAVAADPAPQPVPQSFQYRHRLRPRAYWQEINNTAQAQSQPLAAAAPTAIKAAKTDGQPVVVMIEAAFVEFTPMADHLDWAAHLLQPGQTAATFGKAVKPALLPRSAVASPLPVPPHKRQGDMLTVGAARSGICELLQLLTSLGEIQVLSRPQLLTLDKQLAEVRVGNDLPYDEKSSKDGVMTVKHQSVFVGTLFRVKPIVLADEKIRLAVYFEKSTGHRDATGIPQIEARIVQARFEVRDGTTAATGVNLRPNAKPYNGLMPQLNCIPGPIGLLNLVPCFESAVAKPECYAGKQLIVLVSPHVVRK
jgi:hypothetical protein